MCFLNNKILYFKLVIYKGMKEVTLQKKNTEPALVRDCCMYVDESFNKLNITKSFRLQPCQFDSKNNRFFFKDK